MKINELKQFIEESKALYGLGKGVVPKGKEERPGFKELKVKKGEWEMTDSYAGYYAAPGQEVIRYKGKPVWHMTYGGKGQEQDYFNMAKETFTFLKQALSEAKEGRFRGNKSLTNGDWKYTCNQKGDFKDFSGEEKVFFKNKLVFSQLYFGGLVIHK